MPFDLSEKRKLREIESLGIDVPITDPATGKPATLDDGKTPITIGVYGSLSDRYREVQAIRRGRMLNSTAPEKADAPKSDKDVGEQSLREQTEDVAACVFRWTVGGFTDGGKPFEYSEKNAITLLTENPTVQFELQRAMGDHARFLERSSQPSKK